MWLNCLLQSSSMHLKGQRMYLTERRADNVTHDFNETVPSWTIEHIERTYQQQYIHLQVQVEKLRRNSFNVSNHNLVLAMKLAEVFVPEEGHQEWRRPGSARNHWCVGGGEWPSRQPQSSWRQCRWGMHLGTWVLCWARIHIWSCSWFVSASMWRGCIHTWTGAS